MKAGRAGPDTLERAHQRFNVLYEISRQLTGFDSVDRTVLALVTIIARTLPLRSAVLVLAAGEVPRTIVWQADCEDAARLREVRAHALRAYSYLVDPVVASEVLVEPAAERRNLVVLPLVLAGRIFGALQLEGAARLDEFDLVFVDSVVNQLAIALDRQAEIEARQAASEARRVVAEHRQIAAEARRALAEKETADVRDQLDFVRAVTGSLGEGVVAVDIDSRVTLLNPAASRMLGWNEREAIGKVVQEVIQMRRASGAPVSLEQCPFAIAMRSGSSIQSEDDLFTGRDRANFSVAYTATALRNGAEVSGAVLAFQDISNRKRAERATAELAAIVTSSDDAIFSKDLLGIVRTWNQGATNLFGYTAEEAIGKPLNFLMPRNRADEGRLILEQVWSGATLQHHETERQRKDGSVVPVALTVSPIRDATGRSIGASLIARDITHRKALEEAQKRSETEQRLLAEVATIVGSSLDRRATLAAVARCVVPLVADLCIIDEVGEDGLTQRLEVVFADDAKQQALGDRVRLFTPRPGWTTPQARVLETGKPLYLPEITDPAAEGVAQDQAHAEVLRASGVRSMIALPLRVRDTMLGVLTLIVGDSGRRFSPHDLALAEEVARRVASGLDNVWLYEQAQRAVRARDELLAIVSHDLKNPLAVILMSTTLMGAAAGAAERRRSRKHVDAIKRCAVRMNRLIEDLLDTASIEAGKLSVEQRRLAVAPLAEETIEAMQSLAASKSLHLRSELPPALPDVFADPSRLQQVFTNLLGNALKFTPDGGTITVRARVDPGEILFSVTDTGPGIADSDIPHLFDRYWQAHPGARKGSGLGLHIVKGIVAAHGGRTWAESRVGAGSTFFFTVPLALPASDRPADAGLEAGSAETLRDEVERYSEELADLGDERRRRDLQAALESTRIASWSRPSHSFDVREMAVDVVTRLRPYAEEKGLDLRLLTASHTALVTSDPVLTRLILLNLIGNAIEFTEHGLVQISIDCVERGCTIAVKDSGPGVPPDDRPGAGMGMRLTLARAVAAALDGHIELESEIGRGSTFTVTLPSLLKPSPEEHAALH